MARGERILPEGKEHWELRGVRQSLHVQADDRGGERNALGGGTELVLAADLVVAVETASFGLPEVRRGLIAGAGGRVPPRAPLPTKLAMELLLTGRPLPAPEALRWGLINRVVPPGHALSAALELAEEIAANAPLAVQGSKRFGLRRCRGRRADERAFWELNNTEIRAVLKSEDAREGPTAFARNAPRCGKPDSQIVLRGRHSRGGRGSPGLTHCAAGPLVPTRPRS